MSKYLFLFSIGPVQSFISQARKTQDLYAGSLLISDLISRTIKLIKERNPIIIFPNEKTDSKPNRFIVEIEMQNDEAMNNLGKFLEKNIKDVFFQISKDIFNKECNKPFPSNFNKQIQDFLEVNWAALPLDKNYNETYADLERFLASVKNVKVFNETSGNRRKCSLCGERNSLFYIGRKHAWFTQEDAIKIYDGNTGEGLCAVCFLKRFYKKNQNFSSTADISLLNCFEKIVSNIDFEEKEKIMRLKRSNAQLFFEENITENLSLKNYDLELIKKLLFSFKYEAKKQKIKITKYYALLMFDGDKMGEWLSGVNLPNKSNLREFHQTFSAKLGEFAVWAKRFVDGDDDKIKKGRAVYAGGDDFLGFINLQYLWNVLSELRKEFENKVSKPLEDEFKLNKEVTFSAGIVVSHFKTPLHFVLQKVHQMEHRAKEKGGRDAFAVAVLKHSGEILETVLKWESANCENIHRINYILSELQNNDFSNTFLKTIQKEFALVSTNKQKNAFDSELHRLIGRSCNLPKEIKSDSIEKIYQKVTDICGSCDYHNEKVFNLFNIIDFFKRETSVMEDFENEN